MGNEHSNGNNPKLFRRVPKNNEPCNLSHGQVRFLQIKQLLLGIFIGFIIRELLLRW
ncbi:hypothetical protein ACFSO7_07635 [Bacillus sp. CGMCC 1.16607]|uniref:hypothetical protein n=1 Tax=Bacillus sp. CGMCC 1.16607 TaxID=3351842 RepID=UPI0036359E50